MVSLLQLPTEILFLIPTFLDNIEDFKNASSTCCRLYDIFSATHPRTILRLASASAPVFFSPHPYFLALAAGRRLSHWASQSTYQEISLRLAFLGGVDGILSLGQDTVGVTMTDIRRLYEARYRILNPLSDKIDRMAGLQWHETPFYWNGGISEPCSLHHEAERAAYQLAIYAELFGPTLESILWPKKSLPRLNRKTRIEFVKYCIPDWTIHGLEGLEVLSASTHAAEIERGDYLCDHVALHHVMTCARWRQTWDSIEGRIGVGFEEEWRQDIWRNSIQLMDMEQLALANVEDTEREISNRQMERLYEIRGRVEELDEAELALDDEQLLPPDLPGELVECCPAELGW